MIDRRRLLTGLLATPAVIRRAHAQSKFDWQQCRGMKLEVLLCQNPRGALLQAHEQAFTALTSIEVASRQVPEQQQRREMAAAFIAGQPGFDVVQLSLHVSKRFVGHGRYLEDLRPYLTNPELTDPAYDFADMIPAAVKVATQVDARVDSLPLDRDIWLVYWNQALFAEKHLPFPATLDEMLRSARALTDPARGTYGFVARGQRNANVPVWTNLLLGEDQETVDVDATRLLTDTDRAVWAGQMYKDLLRDCAPPGVADFNWGECQTSFSQGKVAMWMDGIGFTPALVDPATSRIADQVGFGVMPAGPHGHFATVFTEAMGVAATSRTKTAGYLYCQWATGTAMMKEMLSLGAGAPPRLSCYADTGLATRHGFGAAWLAAVLASQKIARPGLPEILPVSEFRDAFGAALAAMIGGADPGSELRAASSAFQVVLDRG